ncbi:MAG: AAA family ATPase [Candidatus Sumerlaeaceae bacterium]|nr:AAA family ATPase [Candidatus Sumerlaeaceae bacterium]
MITRIEVDGYRLLNNFAADLRSLNVVIGANATGKSTLLDCLKFIAECTEVSLDTASNLHWGTVSLLTAGKQDNKVAWRITVQKPKTDVWDFLPLKRDSPLVYEAVLQTDISGRVRPQYEVLRNPSPAPGHIDPFKFLEATPYHRVILDKTKKLVSFDESQPSVDVVQEENSAGEVDMSGDPNSCRPTPQDAALLLSQIRFFNEFPVPSAVRLLLASMRFYPGFEVTRFSALRTRSAEIKPETTLTPTGNNLGTVLHELLTRYDYKATAEDLLDFLHVAYPDFVAIHCDTTYGAPPQVLVRVRERGMPRSMEIYELSDGMLRFLCLATALLNPWAPPLIAVDEPELGLHPRLLPIVADLIKAAAERTQVLVTTHSPDLVNCFGIEDIAVMARHADRPEVVWHRPADHKTLVTMLKDVSGQTLGDLHRSGELETGA